MENWLGSSLKQIHGLTTVRGSYSRALEHGPLFDGYLSIFTMTSLKHHTERLHRMEHRKWRETKHQPSMLPSPAVPGCCLVSFHFLCYILCSPSVQEYMNFRRIVQLDHPVEGPSALAAGQLVLLLDGHLLPDPLALFPDLPEEGLTDGRSCQLATCSLTHFF